MEESERRRATFPCASHTIHFTSRTGPGSWPGFMSWSENQLLHLLPSPSSGTEVFFPPSHDTFTNFCPRCTLLAFICVNLHFNLVFPFYSLYCCFFHIFSFLRSLFSNLPLPQMVSVDVPFPVGRGGGGHIFSMMQFSKVKGALSFSWTNG